MPPLDRRQFLATLGAGAAALMLPQPAPAAAPAGRKPNIIFILADDLGQGDLGFTGQKLLKTPNIDRLAAEGIRFLNAYAGSMVCAPSRCTLMTGRHTGHATVRNNWEVFPEGQFPLRADEVTVAQVLKGAGYATGLCGKWGLGHPGSAATPEKKGFDFFFGYNCQRHAHDYYTDYLYRNTERIAVPQTPERRTNTQDPIARESLNFIRENKDRPFFLFCAWTLPHGPYGTGQVPSLAKYAGQPWSDAQKVYAAMVERLDADVGRVMALLGELGLEDNTLVVFASDNGAVETAGIKERFSAHTGLRGGKGSLFEGGLRVPLIARWPGRVPAGRTTGFATAFWDFLPTAAELAGATAPSGIDGISIVPTLLGKTQPPHEYLYWEQPGGNRLKQAVRLGNWKGYRPAAGAPVRLYALADDPGESRDVAAAHPAIVKRLEAIMRAAHVETKIPKGDPRVWQKYAKERAKKI